MLSSPLDAHTHTHTQRLLHCYSCYSFLSFLLFFVFVAMLMVLMLSSSPLLLLSLSYCFCGKQHFSCDYVSMKQFPMCVQIIYMHANNIHYTREHVSVYLLLLFLFFLSFFRFLTLSTSSQHLFKLVINNNKLNEKKKWNRRFFFLLSSYPKYINRMMCLSYILHLLSNLWWCFYCYCWCCCYLFTVRRYEYYIWTTI